MEAHRRTGNFSARGGTGVGGGGAVNNLPKISRMLPKFLRNSRKETKVRYYDAST